MITKVLYFRPDRHFVNDEDLQEKYNCMIRDEFTTAENHITVPIYLTVLQHHIPKFCYKPVKPHQGQHKKQSSSSYKFLEKICFYLVGSKQAPMLTEFSSDLSKIDRIEFKGHIGFELPIFEIIRQLPALRKVSFFINPCKQGNFVISDYNNDRQKTPKEEKFIVPSSSNLLVTNVKMAFEKCTFSCRCKATDSNEKDHHVENVIENGLPDTEKLESDQREILKSMIIRLLQRMVKQCPNIKRLCMDVPSYKGVMEVIESTIAELGSLKPTNVSCVNGNILVRKREDGDTVSSDNDAPKICEGITTLNVKDPLIENNDKLEQDGSGEKKDITESADDKSNQTVADEPEPSPCLFDMSKLLGSMLGIPTSSLPPGSSQSSTTSISNQSSTSGSHNGDSTPEPQNLNDCQSNGSTIIASTTSTTKPITTSDSSMNSTVTNHQRISATSTSTVEVITYAAAAASAATTNTTSSNPTSNNHRNQHHNIRAAGNDNNGHHHRHRHFNEGSRRTFLRDGEGPVAADEEELNKNKNKKKPSFPHVADLGKPVFVASSNCKSPHKRGSINHYDKVTER